MAFSVILDIVCCVGLAVAIIIGIIKGFVNQIFKLISTIIAILLSYFLCDNFVELLDGLFHIVGSIANLIEPAFSKNEALNTVYNPETFSSVMQTLHLPSFLIKSVQEFLAPIANMTLAQGIATVIAKYILTFISFFVIFIIAKLLLLIVKGILNGLTSLPIIGTVNRALGGVLGCLSGLLIVYIVLYVLSMIPSNGLQSILASTTIVKFFYNHNLLALLLKTLISNIL